MAVNPIRHASAVKPRIYPYNGDVAPQDVNRLQVFNGSVTTPSDAVYEIGRLLKMADDTKISEQTTSMTQLEYGQLENFLALANLAAKPVGGLQLSDFDNSLVDIVSLGKDKYQGNLEQTLWLPKAVLDAFTLSVADSDARIERQFTLKGDFYRILRYDNKNFIYKKFVCATGDTPTMTLSVADPVPVVDPNYGTTSTYIARILKVSGGTTVELAYGTDYTFNPGTNNITILASTVGDIYKVYYTASSFGTAGDPTSLNDIDDYFLKAENLQVYLTDGVTTVKLDILTSLNITATWNRINEGVIGQHEKILKSAKDHSVTVALNGRVKNATIEEVLMGKAGQNWGILDVDLFIKNASLIVKVFNENSHTNFLIGYRVNKLIIDTTAINTPVNDYLTSNVNLKSDEMIISDSEADLA